MPPEPKTPPHRRLVATGTTGVFRRGDRFVAISYRHGRRIKTTHDTKRDACAARARRMVGPAPSRERFENYAERWLVEYRGRTARGLAPSTREAYAWTMRTYVIPYFRGTRIGDLRRADVKRFIDHLNSVKPRQSQQGATRLAGVDDPQDRHAAEGDARRGLRARSPGHRRRPRARHRRAHSCCRRPRRSPASRSTR